MPWSRSRPGGSKTRPKYTSKEHRDTRAQHMAELKRAGSGQCAEVVCVYASRLITPSMQLHLCHDRRTGQVRGLGHARCNLSEAGRYARSMQDVTTLRW
jgi:hypothetical protein